ncbi:hypothetical protein L6R53_28755, partial [Myxococcota bacterium]|nr:hypothetical protein [Myxococcota bacterium]
TYGGGAFPSTGVYQIRLTEVDSGWENTWSRDESAYEIEVPPGIFDVAMASSSSYSVNTPYTVGECLQVE